jgi:ABC-type phosphate transport system auxiliary subunit
MILARCAQADYVGLAPILDPLKQMLSELTRTLYITEREEEETSTEDQSMQIRVLEIQLAKAKLLKERKELEDLIDPTVQGDQESRQNLLYRERHFEIQKELVSLRIAEKDLHDTE